MKKKITQVFCYRADHKERKELNAAMRYLKFETRSDTIKYILKDFIKQHRLEIFKAKKI